MYNPLSDQTYAENYLLQGHVMEDFVMGTQIISAAKAVTSEWKPRASHIICQISSGFEVPQLSQQAYTK